MVNPDRPASAAELPGRIPIFPLNGVILLPGGRLPLNIFEPRYLAMTRDAMGGGRLVGMVQPLDSTADLREPPVYDIGCVGRVVEFAEAGDGRYLISLAGVCRFRIVEEIVRDTPYRQVLADYADYAGDFGEVEGLHSAVDRDRLIAVLRTWLERRDMKADWEAAKRASDVALVNSLSMMLPLEPGEKQALLEAGSVPERAAVLTTLLEMAVMEGGGSAMQ